jgi:hypothetical protein
MALAPYSPTPIVVDVSDRVISPSLRVKQRAHFVSLLHDYDAQGQPQAHIAVLLRMYAAEPDGSYGPELNLEGFVARPKGLVAANDTLVDAADGTILAIRTEGENWQAVLDRFEQPTMLQGNFFEYLRDNVPVMIGTIIRQHIHNADALGRFA